MFIECSKWPPKYIHTSKSILSNPADITVTLAERDYFHEVRHVCTLIRSTEQLPHGPVFHDPLTSTQDHHSLHQGLRWTKPLPARSWVLPESFWAWLVLPSPHQGNGERLCSPSRGSWPSLAHFTHLHDVATGTTLQSLEKRQHCFPITLGPFCQSTLQWCLVGQQPWWSMDLERSTRISWDRPQTFNHQHLCCYMASFRTSIKKQCVPS